MFLPVNVLLHAYVYCMQAYVCVCGCLHMLHMCGWAWVCKGSILGVFRLFEKRVYPQRHSWCCTQLFTQKVSEKESLKEKFKPCLLFHLITPGHSQHEVAANDVKITETGECPRKLLKLVTNSVKTLQLYAGNYEFCSFSPLTWCGLFWKLCQLNKTQSAPFQKT